jgi:hypothetical protein
MILTVIRKAVVNNNVWECIDENGMAHRVDLVVDSQGKINADDIKFCDKFSVGKLHPYITIGINCERIKDEYKDHLCGEECDISQCPEEPAHCEYGLTQLQGRAEMRADLARDAISDRLQREK